MANAKKCDRCGSYYDSNTEYKLKCTLGGHAYIAGIGLMTANRNALESFDLCDACLSDFKEFMEAKKTECTTT